MLSKPAIVAISVVSFLLISLALLCCIRLMFIRRRRAKREQWSQRPAIFTRRRPDSGWDFVTPRSSSDNGSLHTGESEGQFAGMFTGPPPSWSKASATQQRRMLRSPDNSSVESYGTPVAHSRLATQEMAYTSPTTAQPLTLAPPPTAWAYHRNAPLSASSVGIPGSPAASFAHRPVSVSSSMNRPTPDHSNTDLDAVGGTSMLPYADSPVEPRAMSPFVTIIHHPDGAVDVGADLDEPVRPTSPPRAALAAPPGGVVRAITPVSPLFATSFGDPFASPLDGAQRS